MMPDDKTDREELPVEGKFGKNNREQYKTRVKHTVRKRYPIPALAALVGYGIYESGVQVVLPVLQWCIQFIQ